MEDTSTHGILCVSCYMDLLYDVYSLLLSIMEGLREDQITIKHIN